jgi:HEAT repeat protein
VLGAAGDTEHVAPVLAALEDPDEAVRRAAVRAVRRMENRLDLPQMRGAD